MIACKCGQDIIVIAKKEKLKTRENLLGDVQNALHI